MTAPVFFLGSGIHTALGSGTAAHLRALEAGLQPAQPATVAFADQTQVVPYRLLANLPLATPDRLWPALEATIEDALTQAGLDASERRNMALLIGSSSYDISISEVDYQNALRVDPGAMALANSSSIGNFSSRLRRHFDLRGPDLCFNTACTASANALLYADALVRSGAVAHALVIGVEMFNTITAMGFHSLNLLTPTRMKPFDKDRDGLMLGEACTALVIGRKRRFEGDFYLRGAANLCDRHSISAANPDGSTVATVIRQALAAAQLEPESIGALKTHGTASLLNDEAEVAGMRQVFAQLPPLCALKPWLGHTLGACGLTELVLFCAAAQQGFLIATPGICAAQSDLAVELNQHPRALKAGNFMLNYFGFGGNNTSLVLSNQVDAH